MATYYIDAAAGSDANAGTSAGAGNAFATIGKFFAVCAAGDKGYVKASGSYNEAPGATTTAGTEAAPIVLEGYTATPGDGGKATIDAQNTRATCLTISKSWNRLANLTLTGATTRCVDVTASLTGCAWTNCQFLKGSGTAGYGWDSSVGSAITVRALGCYWSGFATNAITKAYCHLFGCEFAACGPIATGVYANTLLMFRCLIRGGSGPGVQIGNNSVSILILNNTVYGKTSGSGIQIAGPGLYNIVVQGNIAAANAAYGLDLPNSAGVSANYNAFYGNTSGPRSGTTLAGTGDVILAADPFVDAAGGNFALNATAGAGAAARGAGFPGVWPGGTSTGYPDLGAVQHQDSGGGAAGGLIRNPAMNG